jgi:hypothetical protein
VTLHNSGHSHSDAVLKPGINPDTGLPYPPRRRLTLDYRKVNSVVQVDAARIPDVKETVQSLRVLAGESQRQVNARRDGTHVGYEMGRYTS